MTPSRLFLMATAFALTACQSEVEHKTATDAVANTAKPEVNVRPNAIKAHIDFLADDLLEGRDTGSKGYDIAANYVVSHFSQFGLKPAGDNGGYTQQVRFRQRLLKPDSAVLQLQTSNGDVNFSYPNEFITGGSSVATSQSINAPLVFVGHGISAPELNHDDYAQVDVTDKIVVLLTGKPGNLPSEEGAHFASRYQRAKAAAKHGAVGMIYLQTPEAEKRYSYQRMQKNVDKPSLNWLDAQGEPGNSIPQLKGGALLSMEASEKLMQSAPQGYQALVEMAESKQPLPTFDLGFSATIASETEHDEITSANVAGIVEGTDPQLKNEYVVYTAHLDHIGGHHTDGDSDHINNGALDNASGTAIMLETARLFAENPTKRSILFVAVTAEEKGLLGSDYYAQNPTVPVEQMVANVNLDMPLILYPIGDVIAFGAEHSTMGDFVQHAVERIGLQLSPDPMPEQNIFVRSDHYSFVKQGVPSVFLVPGFKSLDESVNGGEIFKKFFAEHYHQPSDEATLPIDYQAGARFTKVNYLIGKEIANSASRPQWKEGDFFGDTFGKR